jgi:hypothetical protein
MCTSFQICCYAVVGRCHDGWYWNCMRVRPGEVCGVSTRFQLRAHHTSCSRCQWLDGCQTNACQEGGLPAGLVFGTRGVCMRDGDRRAPKEMVSHTHKRESLFIQCCTPEGYQPVQTSLVSPLVSCLDSTPQSLFPKTADAILLAPLLHHPSFKLIPNNFPLVNLWRRIFLLATPCLSLVLQPRDLSS